jgi:phenylalanyl-tRNA synthetase alpha chain
MVEYKSIEREVWTLTEEGQELAESGSHEARVFDAIPAGEEGITIPDLQVSESLPIRVLLESFIIN